MKNRASLVLIELCTMLLVLALAAALCLRIFVWADQSAKENAVRDVALVRMQTVAEKIKATGNIEEAAKAMGAIRDGNGWCIAAGNYEIKITPMDDLEETLGSAHLEAVYRERVLVSFSVCWQEVA